MIKTEKQLFQWDINQKLLVSDADYVDFLINGEVYRVEVNDGECLVPDELFQKSGVKTVWACCADGTRIAKTFGVESRPMPPDYVYTPTQRLTFDGLVQKVDALTDDLQRRADSGEFNGKDGRDGRDGVDGKTPVKGVDYFDGKDGRDGVDGKDADPYDDTEIRNIITAEATTRMSEDARVLSEAKEYVDTDKVASIEEADETSTKKFPSIKAIVDWVRNLFATKTEMQTALAEKVSDVQVNGSSIVDGGVANIPAVTKTNQLGAIQLVGDSLGIGANGGGVLKIVSSANSKIDTRDNNPRPITTQNLDYAVKQAMCDGKGADWTPSEQLSARQRIGIENSWRLLADITLEEDGVVTYIDENLQYCKTFVAVCSISGKVSGAGDNNLYIEFDDGVRINNSMSQTDGSTVYVYGYIDVERALILTPIKATSSGSTLNMYGTAYGTQNRLLAELIKGAKVQKVGIANYVKAGSNVKLYAR